MRDASVQKPGVRSAITPAQAFTDTAGAAIPRRLGDKGSSIAASLMTAPDLNTLAVFAQLVEAKSFTKAARLLQMPASTVSRKIAELEKQLGVQLVERTTRQLRLTDVGSEIYEQARRSRELSETIAHIAANHSAEVSGVLKISAPPSISDSLLAPLIIVFQRQHPDVTVQVFVTERIVDHISEGIDLAFRVGQLTDSSLVLRKLLTYRHQLLASPKYLKGRRMPQHPNDLKDHRLVGFSFWTPERRWHFAYKGGKEAVTHRFRPYFSTNEYGGIAAALVAGVGIGDFPPIVQPHLLTSGALVEVMPDWVFRPMNLYLVHAGNRYVPKIVRVFKDFAATEAARLFPNLPV